MTNASHVSEIDIEKWLRRWPNFHPEQDQIACPCCGMIWVKPSLMDILQGIRRRIDPLTMPLNSVCRCERYNASIGGAPNSYHLQGRAADVAANSTKKHQILMHARGITGIGVYTTFLHLDIRLEIPVLWRGTS